MGKTGLGSGDAKKVFGPIEGDEAYLKQEVVDKILEEEGEGATHKQENGMDVFEVYVDPAKPDEGKTTITVEALIKKLPGGDELEIDGSEVESPSDLDNLFAGYLRKWADEHKEGSARRPRKNKKTKKAKKAKRLTRRR